MPTGVRARPRRGSVRPVAGVILLVGWLIVALAATASGTVVLAPLDPCGKGSRCAGSVIFVAEYVVRYGLLLLFLVVLPPAVARLMQHRDPLPVIAAGLTAAAVLLAVVTLIVAVAG